MPRFYSSYTTPAVRKKKRKYTRTGRKIGSTSTSTKAFRNQLMKVVRNPFCNVPDARIPDGKAHHSVPLKTHNVREVTLGNDIVTYLFYPGFNSCVTYKDGTGERQLPLRGTSYMVDAEGGQINGGNKVSQWRLVSSALRVSLINNAVTNEGWFECARFSIPHEDSQIAWRADDDNTAQHSTFFRVDDAVVNENDMITQPSYTTGKLRDLDQCIFRLKSVSDARDFSTLRTAEPNEGYRGMDPGFDGIWLRVHGISGTTKLLSSCVANHEIVYDQTSTMTAAMRLSRLDREGTMMLEREEARTPSSPFTTTTALAIVTPQGKRRRM